MRGIYLRLPIYASCFLGVFALGSIEARAGAGDQGIDDGSPDGIDLIWGGQSAQTCAWPTAVAVTGGGSLCTGTLVHPRLVIYAAHCDGGNKTITFGEGGAADKSVGTQSCVTNPSWSGSQGNDWAYCVLDQEVDLPVTPIGYGCELDTYLYDGAEVAIVGFGNNSGGSGAGTKRWAMTQISDPSIGQNRFDTGGGGLPTVCSGDSGGPAFIQYADGSWHTYGIASTKYSGTCDSAAGTHSLAPGAVSWIESSSGYDVTPCHDVNGNWQPGPECGNFYAGGANGTGTWYNWCEGTPAGDWSETCGPGFGTEAEDNPPLVDIVTPGSDRYFEGDTSDPITFEVSASDDSGSVLYVELQINGDPQGGQDESEPYEFGNVVFPEGSWEVVAVAEDFWGNLGYSEPVVVTVGDEPPPDPPDDPPDTDEPPDTDDPPNTDEPPDTDDPHDTDDLDGSDDDDDGGFPPGFGEDDAVRGGCACAASRGGEGVGSIGLVGLVGLVIGGALRRGRRRGSRSVV